jgi:hypothetical protein
MFLVASFVNCLLVVVDLDIDSGHCSLGHIKFGSNIPYVGKREYRYSMNLKSANENPDILREFFFKEVKAGRVDGPFDVPPFSNLQISPLGLVPKKKIGEYRIIHHLSYPDQLSVIDGIPQDMCTVQYLTHAHR